MRITNKKELIRMTIGTEESPSSKAAKRQSMNTPTVSVGSSSILDY